MYLNHLDTTEKDSSWKPPIGVFLNPSLWKWGPDTHTGVIRNTAFKQLSVALKGNQGRSHRGEQICKEACMHRQTKMQPSRVEKAQHRVPVWLLLTMASLCYCFIHEMREKSLSPGLGED